MTHPSIRHFGNGTTGREGTYKRRAISDRRADDLTKPGQFLDQLLTLKRTGINTIGHENQLWMPVAANANRIDDFEGSDRSFNVEPRRRAWHEDETSGRNRSAKSSVIGRYIDHDVSKIHRYPIYRTNPIGNRVVGKRYFVYGESQVSKLSPLAGRPLRIGVDQGDLCPTALKLGSDANRQGGLTDATFTLCHCNDVVHLLILSGRCFLLPIR